MLENNLSLALPSFRSSHRQQNTSTALPLGRCGKIWIAVSALFHFLDSESLINFTAVNKEHRKYMDMDYTWRILFNRQNKEYILKNPSINLHQIDFKKIYLQLKSLHSSLDSLDSSELIIDAVMMDYVETVDLIATLSPKMVNRRFDHRSRGWDYTALSMAIARHAGLVMNQFDMVNTLLKHGATTEHFLHVLGSRGGDGIYVRRQCSVLMLAAANSSTECMNFLLTVPNVNINAVDENGRTALIALIGVIQSAAESEVSPCHLERIKRLIEYGADINKVTTEGNTALSYAAQIGTRSGSKKVIQLLLTPHPPLIPANVDFRDRHGKTALIEVAARGNLSAIECLLQCGANMELQDGAGMTALMHATLAGHLDEMHALLSRGANTEARDPSGCTALFYAVLGIKMQIEALDLLLLYNAHIDTYDADGISVLRCAIRTGNLAAMLRLIDHDPTKSVERSNLAVTHAQEDSRFIELIRSMTETRRARNRCHHKAWRRAVDSVLRPCISLDRFGALALRGLGKQEFNRE